jgi:C1A family cysteine protease
MKKTLFSFFKLSALVVTFLLILTTCKKESTTNPTVVPTSDKSIYPLGCEMLPASDYAMLPKATVPPAVLKRAVTTVLNLNVPPVSDQGSEGSCVAFGTTYAGRSINWQSTHSGAWSKSVNIFSPEYVYNQIKINKQCSSGAYVVDGLKLLKSQGVCTWSIMPYVDGQCSQKPSTSQKNAALPYKIVSYGTVAINATTIKSYLDAGKAVIVAGPVNMDFEYLAANAVLTKFTGGSLGGHCYCVVGYDDTKGAFKFMNSWGTSWATSGFGYIAYANIASWWGEAYVIN